MGYLFNEMVIWIAQLVLKSLDVLRSMVQSSQFPSPDVTVMPQVIAVSGHVTWIVNTCFVLAVVTAGILAMTSDGVETRYTVKDLAPRLVVSLVAANMAIPICRQLIRVANAVTGALTGEPFHTGNALTQLFTHVNAAMSDPTNAVLSVMIAVLVVVLVVGLILGWIIRIGVLVILLCVAPAALACYCLPQLESVAGLWWRSILGCLATQALQVLTLYIGLKVFLDPHANVPALLGIPAGNTWNLFVVVAILLTAVRIPALMRRYVTQSHGGRRMPVVLRLLIIEPVARSIGLKGAARRLITRGVR